ncbi:MAG: hypothetical protein M0Z30_15875 [Actinomycetota bacterium]|nr:hypothetical protein [Actinomycetota bacterium]
MELLTSSPGILAVGLNGTGYYIHWGFIQMSLANLIVILLMLTVFVAALVVPFPGHRDDR